MQRGYRRENERNCQNESERAAFWDEISAENRIGENCVMVDSGERWFIVFYSGKPVAMMSGFFWLLIQQNKRWIWLREIWLLLTHSSYIHIKSFRLAFYQNHSQLIEMALVNVDIPRCARVSNLLSFSLSVLGSRLSYEYETWTQQWYWEPMAMAPSVSRICLTFCMYTQKRGWLRCEATRQYTTASSLCYRPLLLMHTGKQWHSAGYTRRDCLMWRTLSVT